MGDQYATGRRSDTSVAPTPSDPIRQVIGRRKSNRKQTTQVQPEQYTCIEISHHCLFRFSNRHTKIVFFVFTIRNFFWGLSENRSLEGEGANETRDLTATPIARSFPCSVS